jgi:diguanylate cyclase (GGDEF)-like protein/PAS domain S-box-containing protein
MKPVPRFSPRFLVFAACYILLWLSTWYCARLLDVLGSASLWFLPAGLRFACLLLLGWPGLLLELVANLAVSLLQFGLSGAPWPGLLSARMFWFSYEWYAYALAYAAVVFPLRWCVRGNWDLSRPAHCVLFIAGALLASTLAALAGMFQLVATGAIAQAQGAEVAVSWLTGDFIGIVILAPLLLVRAWPRLRLYLQQGRWTQLHKTHARSLAEDRRADLHITLMVVPALLLVFAVPYYLDVTHFVPLIALLLLLPLVGAALRYNLRGAVLAVVLLGSGLAVMTSLFNQRELALQYQLVMVAIALVGLWLGGAVESRNHHMLRNRDFARASNDLLWEINKEGQVLSISGRLAKHIRLAPGQFWNGILEGVSQPHLKVLENALARQRPFRHLEIAVQGRESNQSAPLWMQVNGLPVWDDWGDLTGYRGTATDITPAYRAKTLLKNYNQELLAEVARHTLDLRQTNSELALKEQRLQVLLAAAPVGVLELDSNDCCRYLNVNGGALTACTPEQAQGRHFLEFVHPEDRSRVEYAWTHHRHSHGVQWLEFRLSTSTLWCTAYWIHLRHADGSPAGAIMVLADSTARRQQDERLWTLAHHDTLTSLPNRNLFWDRCAQAMSLAKRHDSGVAMLWLDLDGFKSVNDRLGHAAGDALLQQVAQRLKGRIRDSDTVARMGGDEFAVVMPEITSPETAVRIAQALVASLGEVFDLPQGPAHISGSIGVALFPLHAHTVETLTQYADVAMYSAKRAGKNQVQVWSPACDKPLTC